MNFDNWNNTPIEKAHLRFCKMFLEVNKKAANHASRAEMGRFPIQTSITSLIFKYYIYLNGKEDNSIVKQGLIISQDLGFKSHNSYHSTLLEILQFFNPRLSRRPKWTYKSTYKVLHSQAPTYISELLVPYKPARTLRSSSVLLLKQHKNNLKNYGYRQFQVSAPCLWNSLPSASSVNCFKSKLKTYLYEQSYT